ncbi:MAG: hypothetical protein IJE43_10990 [Alphaproteobacteria bacterium]|nr:hypothetical protein [Alphaproteobacteria bacterium]
MDKKFIIVKDKPTADKLSAAGFILLSQIGGTYTFKNEQKNFNFTSVEKGKICYSNILSL